MAKFKLKPNCGTHREKSDIFASGAVIESEKNLAALFPEKFDEVDPSTPVSEPFQSPHNSEQKKAVEAQAQNTAGEDVTDQFPLAKDADLVVVKQGRGKCTLLEDGEIVEGAEGLTKKKMQSFLESYVVEEDEEDAEE